MVESSRVLAGLASSVALAACAVRLRGATGEQMSNRRFGPGQASFDWIAAEPGGRMVAAGRLDEQLDLCGHWLVSAGRQDVLLAELSP